MLPLLATALAPSAAEAPPAAAPLAETDPVVDDTFELGTVIRTRRPANDDVTSDRVEVDGETLRESTRPSTLEALSQETPGLFVPGRGLLHGVANGATGGVFIRGLGGSPNSQTLVVEDGVPDYMGIFGHPIPDAYVPALIDDATVILGGDSVLYGNNAMGGVIVLRSRWRQAEGFEATNDAAFGSYSTIRETASLLGRTGPLQLAAAFHVMSTEGQRRGAGGDQLIGHAATRLALSPNLELVIRNKVAKLEGFDPGPVTHPNPNHWYDVLRNNASARLQWRQDRFDLSLASFLNLGIHRLYDGFRSEDYLAGFIAEGNVDLNETTRLRVGAAAQHVDGQIENRLEGSMTTVEPLSDVSAYAQITAQPMPGLWLVGGARALYSLAYGFVPLFKGGARYVLSEAVTLRSRIARNYRQPTLRELYLPFPTANPNLQPEVALNSDAGIDVKAGKLAISFTAYRTQAQDLIRYFGAFPTAEVINIDRFVVWGAEARIALSRLGPFSVSVGGDVRDVGRYTRQNPQSKVNASLEANTSFGRHSLSGGLVSEWVSGIYTANYGRGRLPDAFFTDLSLRYRHQSNDRGVEVEPYLLLRNLFDQRYAFVEGYPLPGFNALLGLELRFL